jgi:hypothetical protein
MIERELHDRFIKYTDGGISHRTNGPAFEWYDGDWAWYLFGCPHRYYGAANSYDSWWIHHTRIKKK